MTVLRAVDTPRAEFRAAMSEAAAMLAYEATRGLPQRDIEVLTPLETTSGKVVDRPIMVVAVLRAGLGMVEGFLRLVPDAAVGHLGMRRNEETLRPDGYYESLPEGVGDSVVFVVDPMLATGGAASAALTRLREVARGICAWSRCSRRRRASRRSARSSRTSRSPSRHWTAG